MSWVAFGLRFGTLEHKRCYKEARLSDVLAWQTPLAQLGVLDYADLGPSCCRLAAICGLQRCLWLGEVLERVLALPPHLR